jgi:hypothetical protein
VVERLVVSARGVVVVTGANTVDFFRGELFGMLAKEMGLSGLLSLAVGNRSPG